MNIINGYTLWDIVSQKNISKLQKNDFLSRLKSMML